MLELAAISAPVPLWLEDIKASYTTDAKAQDLLTKLVVSSSAAPNFTLNQGLLRYKGRLWIGADSTLHLKIIEVLHASLVGGHSGFLAT